MFTAPRLLYLKSILKQLLPPAAVTMLRRLRRDHGNRLRFTGDYPTWEAARKDCVGYDALEILEITRAAMLKIKRGEAAYERDSVLFVRPEPPYPLICGLLRAATRSGSRLSVLDFGGALGSSYYQCRGYLDGLPGLRWSVVEQPAHVACGQTDFVNDHLKFYATAADCIAAEQPNVLLLSSVLQYLPDPHECLTGLLRHRIPHVLADRTAFLSRDQDRLTVQQVPSSIYPASYPAWFLSKSRFLACFEPDYRLVSSFSALDLTRPEDESAFHEGFIFELRAPG